MEPLMTEWASLGLRWLHVVTGIAWIGSSFYFVALDLGLKNPGGLPRGVAGEAWQVHGGGFYNMRKYMVVPPEMPEELTWFKWEAYFTWISGFFLLGVVYYSAADLFLIDQHIMALAPWQATAIGIASLAVGWLLYDGLCRSPLAKSDATLALAVYLVLVVIAIGYTHVFSGRGAYVHMGALIGTIMVANVAMVIIPNQKKVVASLIAGDKPDPVLGKVAKQRSLHNNYLTLPVIFLMISNHYPMTFASTYNWAIFAVVMAMGPVIRHFFNTRHQGKPSPWWTWAVVIFGAAVIVWLSGLQPGGKAPIAAAEGVTFAQAQEVIGSRCSMCHAAEPAWEGVAEPPLGVVLETPDEMHRYAKKIRLQAVLSHAMPPGNVTEITPQERSVLAGWISAGAPITQAPIQ